MYVAMLEEKEVINLRVRGIWEGGGKVPGKDWKEERGKNNVILFQLKLF